MATSCWTQQELLCRPRQNMLEQDFSSLEILEMQILAQWVWG